MSNETVTRSIVKTLGYRIILIITNSIIIFVLTKRIDITIGATLAITIANTVTYFLYERAWNSIGWEKKSSRK